MCKICGTSTINLSPARSGLTKCRAHCLLGVVCCVRHQPSLAACVTGSPSLAQRVQHWLASSPRHVQHHVLPPRKRLLAQHRVQPPRHVSGLARHRSTLKSTVEQHSTVVGSKVRLFLRKSIHSSNTFHHSCSAPSNELCVIAFTAISSSLVFSSVNRAAISSTNQLNRRIGVCHTWATFLASVNTRNCLITNLSLRSQTELFHTDSSHPVLGRIWSPSMSVSWNRGSHSQLYELTQAARASSATLLSPVLAERMRHHRRAFNLHVWVRQSSTSLHWWVEILISFSVCFQTWTCFRSRHAPRSDWAPRSSPSWKSSWIVSLSSSSLGPPWHNRLLLQVLLLPALRYHVWDVSALFAVPNCCSGHPRPSSW